MKSQMTLSEKRKIADEFIKRTNPYERKASPIIMDLRGYADYVAQNHIATGSITDEMMMKFAKQL